MFSFVYLLQNIEAAFGLCHSVKFLTAAAAHATRETQCNVKCQSDPRQRHAKHLHTTWTPANLPFRVTSVYCVAHYDRCQGRAVYVLSAFSVSSTAGILIHESS